MLRKIKIGSKLSNLRIIENAIDNITFKTGINQDNYGKILIGTLEAVNNAIVHGNKSDESKSVEVNIILDSKNLEVTVTDEGKGFKPSEVPDPTKPENIEALNGRGIFLMSKLADDIQFNKKGNQVKLIFKNVMA
ncbi:MAG: ATP-binding protein [Ignavibacteriales bacterium]|nr:MAG: ATP-binding protein [Ignavibacteriales bacterium]